MSTIGLDKLYYAKIARDANDYEIYGAPKMLAKAMKADLSVEFAEGSTSADDAIAETVKEFKNGKISLGVNDIGKDVASDLTGARVDANGVLVDSGEDNAPEVAVGFRAKKANGKYRYFWIYRVKFAVPAANLQTKGDSINFATPTIEGTIMLRNKPDALGKHPWKAEVTEGEQGVPTSTIANWYQSVYEPSFTGGGSARLSSLSVFTSELNPAFSPDVTGYVCGVGVNNTYFSAETEAKDAVISATINGEVTAPDQSFDLNAGDNTLRITVNDGEVEKTYIVIIYYGV